MIMENESSKDENMRTEEAASTRTESCVYCGKKIDDTSLVKIYEKYSCDECAYKITGKKRPQKKEDPLRKQYKDMINKLNM